jgi:hypothetical protein
MISDWFDDWLARALAVFADGRLPDSESETGVDFYSSWRNNFVLNGVTDRDVADAMADRVAAAPRRGGADYLPLLLDAARAIYRERAERGDGHDPNSREAAERASKGCDDCGGAGLTVRWRHKSAAPGVPPTITLYCRCPMGRWIERDHRERHPDVRRRVHDLADYPWLWGEEYRTPQLDPAYRPPEVKLGEVAKPAGGRHGPGLGPLPPFVPTPEAAKQPVPQSEPA